MKIEINDKRQQKDFKKITFSTYKKSDVKKELIKCIYNGKIEKAKNIIILLPNVDSILPIEVCIIIL